MDLWNVESGELKMKVYAFHCMDAFYKAVYNFKGNFLGVLISAVKDGEAIEQELYFLTELVTKDIDDCINKKSKCCIKCRYVFSISNFIVTKKYICKNGFIHKYRDSYCLKCRSIHNSRAEYRKREKYLNYQKNYKRKAKLTPHTSNNLE